MRNLVSNRVAGHYKPRPVALFMIPKLFVFACGIIAQIPVFIKPIRRIGRIGIWALNEAFIAEVDELCGVTRTKERMVYDHAVPLSLCLQRLQAGKIIVKNPVISVQIGLIALSFFIDQMTAFKAI
jgi:hypothetical protein